MQERRIRTPPETQDHVGKMAGRVVLEESRMHTPLEIQGYVGKIAKRAVLEESRTRTPPEIHGRPKETSKPLRSRAALIEVLQSESLPAMQLS